jgi:CRP/FNR family transcriptional regulator, cyclic AMP receptor protein
VITVADLMREVPFFHGMPTEAIELIASCGSNVHFEAGRLLFREGDPADTFYLLRHGSVSIEAYVPSRGSLVIETIDAGQVVGWSWLFPPYRWHFDAHAVTDVRATAFDGACLRGKCDQDPTLGYDMTSRFARMLIERLQWTQLRLLDIYGHAGGG